MALLVLLVNDVSSVFLYGLIIAVMVSLPRYWLVSAGAESKNSYTITGIPQQLLTLLKTRWRAWLFLINGPAIIQNGYDKSNEQPYEVFSPDNRYVFVSKDEHIMEIDAAPDTVLSLQAASKQMLQPKYTMAGFNWFDRRGTEGIGFVRALRTLLTNNLPEVLPELRISASSLMDEMHASHPVVNDVKQSPLLPMILHLTALTNARAFFGQELCRNEDFMRSAMNFIEQTLALAEMIRLLPNSIAPMVGRALGKKLRSQKEIYKAMIPIAEERLRLKEQKRLGHEVPVHHDCIQWIMETAPRAQPWSADRIVHELMAIWFGSVHVMTTTIAFAMHDLCLHPEYAASLRAELNSEAYAEFEKNGKGLPLLDSFIKESARLTPVESMSTRRQAIQPFTFSDGTHLAIGDWVVTPLRAMLHDDTHFPSASSFHGFRHVHPQVLENLTHSKFGSLDTQEPSQLTDVNKHWHVWGTGRMACPGRYYAAAAMKTIIGQFVLKYDSSLVDETESRFISWRSFIYPRSRTKAVLKPVVAKS
ncbi:cytochrome P450 [Amylocarpus encephaloides]|uniref:Cytochrome P450 n=1 Tax=Amylocarpus encephaloides TaxID=45428 RepID=A0A9P7YRA0_9HELO|nr:cytochrome P450 [Amylocarpus encephaloides]